MPLTLDPVGHEEWTMHMPTLVCAEIQHFIRNWGQQNSSSLPLIDRGSDTRPTLVKA